MNRRDLAFGSLTLAIAGVYYALTLTIPPSELADPIGPQGLPKMYAAILAALSLLLIARSLRGQAESRRAAPPTPANPNRAFRVAGVLAIGVAYILIVPYLGYLLSVAMLITATIYFQGGTINGRSVAVALSGAALFWLLFVYLLRIHYPASLWPSLL